MDELTEIFCNDRYKIQLAFDAEELAALDEYRENLLMTVGIKENSAAWLYGQWFPTTDPQPVTDLDDVWMADYFKRRFKYEGNGYLVTNVGFVFHRAFESDDLFYLVDSDLEKMAQKGHVFDEDGARMGTMETVGAIMQLYGDMKREVLDMKWSICPASRARVKFLPNQ